MSWETGDKERIRKHLRLPVTEYTLAAIQGGMDNLTKRSPETIDTVRELLDELDTLRETLKATYGDSSYALVQADVLKWSEGSRADGPEALRSQYCQEIASALNLSDNLAAVGGADGFAAWQASYNGSVYGAPGMGGGSGGGELGRS